MEYHRRRRHPCERRRHFYIDGTINNSGNTIELNSGTGSLVMRGGALSNGAMTFANGSAVLGSNSLGFLRSVAINGELNLSAANTSLGIGGTTTFTAFRLTGSSVNLYIEPGTTMASPITAEGATTGARQIIMNYGGSGAITIAPAGSIRVLAGSGADLQISQSSSSNVFNSGVISSEGAGRTLLLHAEQGLGDTIRIRRWSAIRSGDRVEPTGQAVRTGAYL